MTFRRRGLVPFYLLITIFILFFILLISINIGNVDIDIKETLSIINHKLFSNETNVKSTKVFIIWNIRFPRILLATLVGGSLSLAGVSLQAVFKNPMAEPYVTGTSAGASFGATLAIVFFKNSNMSIALISFLTSITATFLIYSLSKSRGKISIVNLLLAGVVLSSLLSSFVSLLMIFNQDELINIITYTMGSFGGANWNELKIILFVLTIAFSALISLHKELNILSFGDDSANSMGVEVEKVKRYVLVIASLLTATSVSFAGIIGFVGLIVPHFFRLLIGSNHKYLIPISFFGGGLFMLICDNIARSLLESSEIPVGIITAIIGAPLFLYLLNKSKRSI